MKEVRKLDKGPVVASKTRTRSAEKPIDRDERHPKVALILLFFVLAAGIVAIGYLSYHNFVRNFRVEVEHRLTSIAELKVGELFWWRKERLGDA